MPDLYLIVGLGNPGAQYERTRHNIGFRIVEALAARHNLSFAKLEHKAMIANGNMLGKRVILAKPQTYMNLSGDSVVPLARFYKIDPPRILVICDDIDIPLGTLRIRASGSSGGQNGMKHIMERMGTQEIARVRFGVTRPPGRMDPAAYVLTPFKSDEEPLMLETLDRAVKAAELWLTDGLEIAMTRYNGTGEPKKQKQPAPPVSDDKSL